MGVPASSSAQKVGQIADEPRGGPQVRHGLQEGILDRPQAFQSQAKGRKTEKEKGEEASEVR